MLTLGWVTLYILKPGDIYWTLPLDAFGMEPGVLILLDGWVHSSCTLSRAATVSHRINCQMKYPHCG